MIRFALCAALLAAGLFFEISAVIGVYRFKPALCRMHAAALGDTMGLFFVLLSVMVAAGFSFLTLKLALLVALFWTTSPVSSHLIGRLEYETNEDLAREVKTWKR